MNWYPPPDARVPSDVPPPEETLKCSSDPSSALSERLLFFINEEHSDWTYHYWPSFYSITRILFYFKSQLYYRAMACELWGPVCLTGQVILRTGHVISWIGHVIILWKLCTGQATLRTGHVILRTGLYIFIYKLWFFFYWKVLRLIGFVCNFFFCDDEFKEKT